MYVNCSMSMKRGLFKSMLKIAKRVIASLFFSNIGNKKSMFFSIGIGKYITFLLAKNILHLYVKNSYIFIQKHFFCKLDFI